MAAQALKESKTALGAFFRRKRAQLGAAKAIKATAQKLARLVYRMLKFGEDYVEVGEQYYEQKYCRLKFQQLFAGPGRHSASSLLFRLWIITSRGR